MATSHAKTHHNIAARYARLQTERIAAFKEFAAATHSGAYPQPNHNVPLQDAAFSALTARLVP